MADWIKEMSLCLGWHNSLNFTFGVSHPSPRTFLNWLPKCQFESQTRGIQLLSGRPAKPRDPRYVQLDKNLERAKIQLNLRVGQLFVTVFPDDRIWDLLNHELTDFLKYISYLLIGPQ